MIIKNKIYDYYLDQIIDESSTMRIPRSGEKGKAVNCYVVALDLNKKPHFLATSYNKKNKIINGLIWDGESYKNEGEISLYEIEDYKLEITHYYGLLSVRYNNIYDFAFNRIFKYAYFLLFLTNFYHKREWNKFYREKFVTKNRMELLYILTEHKMNSGDLITQQELMTKLYGAKWVFHPSQKEQNNKVSFYLQSLVDSGHVIKNHNKYESSPKALETIEVHEEQERKFEESQSMQRKIVILTSFIVIFSAIQSGLVKISPLIELSW